MDFVEICKVCTKRVIIKAAKRIFNSDKICRSYCDFYFGVTFFGTHCSRLTADELIILRFKVMVSKVQVRETFGDRGIPIDASPSRPSC